MSAIKAPQARCVPTGAAAAAKANFGAAFKNRTPVGAAGVAKPNIGGAAAPKGNFGTAFKNRSPARVAGSAKGNMAPALQKGCAPGAAGKSLNQSRHDLGGALKRDAMGSTGATRASVAATVQRYTQAASKLQPVSPMGRAGAAPSVVGLALAKPKNLTEARGALMSAVKADRQNSTAQSRDAVMQAGQNYIKAMPAAPAPKPAGTVARAPAGTQGHASAPSKGSSAAQRPDQKSAQKVAQQSAQKAPKPAIQGKDLQKAVQKSAHQSAQKAAQKPASAHCIASKANDNWQKNLHEANMKLDKAVDADRANSTKESRAAVAQAYANYNSVVNQQPQAANATGSTAQTGSATAQAGGQPTQTPQANANLAGSALTYRGANPLGIAQLDSRAVASYALANLGQAQQRPQGIAL